MNFTSSKKKELKLWGFVSNQITQQHFCSNIKRGTLMFLPEFLDVTAPF